MKYLTAVLALSALALGCADTPTDVGPAPTDTDVLLKKGGNGGGKPGGGDGDAGPAEVRIVFDNYVNRNQGYSLIGMDRTGAYTRVLSDAEETDLESLAPRWAPDGQHFVYQREVVGAGRYDLVVGHVDGTIEVIHTGPHIRQADWSPVPTDDGSYRISFIQENDLFMIRPDGTGLGQLTSGIGYGSAIWSRDARQLLVNVDEQPPDATYQSFLELFDVTCIGGCQVTNRTRLDLSAAGITPDDHYGSLDWAHGSDRVLINLVGEGYYGIRDLGILDLTGGAAAASFSFVMSTPGVQEYNGAWSWDDSEVIYVKFPASTKGRSQAGIMIRDLASGVETKIYDDDASFGMDWSPVAPSN